MAVLGRRKRVRKSEKDQVERVARSIRRHKQAAPILTDHSGEIINGHIVVQALRSLGASEAWCAVIDHLDEDERALLHVTLNRLGETGDWDLDALGPLLIELDELGFELETTGFSLPELDIIMSPKDEECSEAEGEEIPDLPVEPVSVSSDTWLIGDHGSTVGTRRIRNPTNCSWMVKSPM
ncbi:ParB N-terminal domain-containing protein [Altererythrobacter xiamenensis]|uniref:ParB N-terminal domain-containing protein n=1 Tax=Altererythrobacter xiamenensis TaxID=1316679 RepID=UPI000A368705|nr:ParB N-terminal domain-containing protein [Altererythrobacter xiamenensis]